MAAPQIPNLTSFRRGPSRGRLDGGGTMPNSRRSKDQIVQNTDSDAATSRLSAVQAGYLHDPFAQQLTNADVTRRLPLMNRGTYIRTTALDRIVDAFLLSQSGKKQIISLGAGSDTRFFRLKSQDPSLDLLYHEIDFEANTSAKIQNMKSELFASTTLSLTGMSINDFQCRDKHLSSSQYYIHGIDLRTLSSEVVIPGLDQLPTLLISECCLVYLLPHEAQRVLEYFLQALSSVAVAIAIYEPIRPNDAFGRTMMQNLTTRGIHLQTLEKYAEPIDQERRLQDLRFESRAADIDFIWRNWIGEHEKERVEALEWMDEVEEFTLFAKHYCVSWGWQKFEQESEWRKLQSP